MPNTYSQIYLHFVFSPKYRQALIKPEYEKELFNYIAGITTNVNQELVRINGMSDHCHMLVRMRPTIALSKFIQLIKANSSKWINENRFLPRRFNWQAGSGIFSVDYHNVNRIIKYIERQKEHHRQSRFKDEYIKLLDQHKVNYEKEYLLDFFL